MTMPRLTKRECEAIEYAIEGLSAKQIARKLGISYRTVELYLKGVRIAFGARNITRACILYDRLNRTEEER